MAEQEVPEMNGRAFGVITIEAEDLRPLIFRPWSATAIASIWSLDDPSYGSYYLRARSKEKLVAKAMRALRRSAHRLGIENPMIFVEDGSGGSQSRPAGLGEPVEGDSEVEVISLGAGHG